MKFELQPDNRGVDDEVLLGDLRRVAQKLGKSSLSKEEYNPNGRFHSATITRRMGWNRALTLAGRSPATTPGTILVIDHLVPWSKGGETVSENLQTLCEPCNGGKSDLTIDDA